MPARCGLTGEAWQEIARLVARELTGQKAVLVADETGDAKSSTECVGTGRQYSGAIKRVGLCQVAVHLAVVTTSVRVVIDRALYLPKDWAADEERRDAAGVPQDIMFATKLQQTAAMVNNALEMGVSARWFASDDVYSGRELRRSIRELGLGYAVGVSHTHTVTDGAGRKWTARRLVNKVLSHQWMRMQTGHGTKGTREYDWTWLDVRADDTPHGHPDGVSVLVARRHRYTGRISLFRRWSAEDATLAQLVEVICRRWRIEETFQLGKSHVGLDESQVTCWNSWMRWSLFSLIAAPADDEDVNAGAQGNASIHRPGKPGHVSCSRYDQSMTSPPRQAPHGCHRDPVVRFDGSFIPEYGQDAQRVHFPFWVPWPEAAHAQATAYFPTTSAREKPGCPVRPPT